MICREPNKPSNPRGAIESGKVDPQPRKQVKGRLKMNRSIAFSRKGQTKRIRLSASKESQCRNGGDREIKPLEVLQERNCDRTTAGYIASNFPGKLSTGLEGREPVKENANMGIYPAPSNTSTSPV